MRVLGDLVRIGSLFGFALVLARCSGTSTDGDDAVGDAGEAGDTGQGATGGSGSGSAGKGESGRGGSAGSATAGIGGSAGSSGRGGSPAAGRGGGGTAGVPGKTGGRGGAAGATDGGMAGVPGAAGTPDSAGEGGASTGEGGAGGADLGEGGDAPGGAGAGGVPEQPELDGDSCSSAIPLEGTVSGSTAAFTNDQTNPSCFTWALAGPDLAYAVSVPPASRFQVTADPTDTFDIAMYLVSPPAENCSALPVCTTSADLSIQGQNEALFVDNYGDTWQSYFLMIDGYGAATSAGDYTLTPSTNPIPSGEACENAIPLAIGTPVTGTLDGFANDYTGQPTCISANARGGDLVYSVTVPAGNTLTVLADPSASMDIALYAFDALTAAQCRAPTACLAAADLGLGGGNETFTYTNSGGPARTIFLHVDRFDQGTVAGGYTLTATLAPAI